MAKLVLFNMITLDGFFEGPDHDIDWHRVDEEFNTFAVEQLKTAGGLVFGRVTYELMTEYWPTSAAQRDDPHVAGLMNSLPKYVFSRRLTLATWANTRPLRGDAVEEMERLKRQPGGDLLLFGSGDLAGAFTAQGLIDEYRLIVNPIALGRGTPLFKDLTRPLPFDLLSARTFANGNVLLVYRPDHTSPE